MARTLQTTLAAAATYPAVTLGSLGLAWLLGARQPWCPGPSAPHQITGRS